MRLRAGTQPDAIYDLVNGYLRSLKEALPVYLNEFRPVGYQDCLKLIESLNGLIDCEGYHSADGVLQFHDYVAVFQSIYRTKPKDSLRLYIPNLIWVNTAALNHFHKWWKQRLEMQVTQI